MASTSDNHNLLEDEKSCEVVCDNVISGTMNRVTFLPSKEDDLWIFLHNNKHAITDKLNDELQAKRSLKYFLCVQLVVKKYTITENGTDVKYEDLYRRTSCVILLQNDNLNDIIEHGFNDIIKKVTDYHEHGSGWVIHKIVKLELYFGTYKPLKGGSYIPTPRELRGKQNCMVNIKNHDDMCFKWCVLASIYPHKSHPNRCQHYYKYSNELDFTGIPFPVPLNKVSLFEKLNNIGVNVIGYDSPKNNAKKELYPLYISKQRQSSKHVNLLLITQNHKTHYILIKKLNSFLKTYGRSKFYCIYCFHGYVRKQLLDEHIVLCRQYGAQKTVLPTLNDHMLYFKDYSMIRRVPYVIYADFESVLLPVQSCAQRTSVSSTTIKQIHIPCGYCIVVVGPSKIYEPKVYRGKNCVQHFFETLFAWERKIMDRLKSPVKLKMTAEDALHFKQCKVCYMCGGPFDNIFNPPVRDHLHENGKYVSACHSKCNLNSKTKYFIPVILHNLKSYDGHLILKYMKTTDRKVSVIPSTKEKYISFSIGHLRFLDSFQFLSASLNTLINNLVKSDRSQFKALNKFFKGDHVNLLLRKGVFPYSYCTSFDKFNDNLLPPKSAFFNDITKEELSDEDYLHAQTVWKTFDIRTLGEYHDLYVKSDTISLCDVFESFRNFALKEYRLDPCHFYTTPGFAFSAMLYQTKVKLELITCPSIYLFIESSLRGGVSQISKRYARSNNPYMNEYNPNLPRNYIFYCDMNNLYGAGLSQYLPYSEFRFLTEQEINKLNILNIPPDSEYGYIVQCDLIYDKKYHDRDCDFPLAVEKKIITNDMLSPYSKMLHEKLQTKIGNYEKLVPNLLDKHDYVCHYRNLQLYVELGLVLSKITRVLEFKQKPWLKSFIDFNTKKRALATSVFEKSLFKYIVNSIYGKSVQNCRKQVNIQLINNPIAAINVLKKPNLKYWNHINEDLVLCHLSKINIKLDKPIYIGFTVLELSKHFMYSFHYKYIKEKYGDKVTLLMMDTDSYVYQIETEDLYKDLYQDKHLFDFSDYDVNHPLHSNVNKKKVGIMKDELNGDIALEFVGLKPKMYSLITQTNDIKRAKGVSRHIVEKVVKHNHYKDCLLKEQQCFYTMTYIQSHLHEIHTVDLHKKSLSPCDTKRYQLDNINSLPYGHYKINYEMHDA